MSLATTLPHHSHIGRNVRFGARALLATWTLSVLLFVFLFTPTVQVLPINSEALNRPLHDLLDLLLVGVWIVLAILRWPRGIIRPQWLALCLWLPPVSYALSIIMYVLMNLSIDIKQLYILIFSMRPLALTGIVIMLCRWGRLPLASSGRVLRSIVWIVAIHVTFVSILAFLQIREISTAQRFMYNFYRYDLANPEIVYEAVVRYGRASSIFHWPNSLSVFLVISLFLLVAYVGNSGRRFWLWIPIVIGIGGVILAGSRGGFAILALGFALIALARRQYMLLLFLCTGAVLWGVFITFVEMETGRVSRLYELIDWVRGVGPMPLTFQLRITNWIEAVSYYATQSTALTGITIVGERVGRLVVDSFDNEYLVYFVWNGIIGFLLFLLFQLGLIVYSVRLTLRRRGPKAVSVLTLFFLLIAFTLPMIAISQEVWSQQRLLHLIFVCLGVLIYYRNLLYTEHGLRLRRHAGVNLAAERPGAALLSPTEYALDGGNQ